MKHLCYRQNKARSSHTHRPQIPIQGRNLWNKLWNGRLSNLIDAIEQLSYLIFLKPMGGYSRWISGLEGPSQPQSGICKFLDAIARIEPNDPLVSTDANDEGLQGFLDKYVRTHLLVGLP
jgi:hypothetical protein